LALAGLLLTTFDARADVTIYLSAYNDIIYSYTPPGPKILFAQLPGGANPQGLAFDTSGNLFAAGDHVYKITPGGTVSLFATLPSPFNAYGMVIDADNNLYVAGAASNEIKKVTPGGTVSTYATGLPYTSRGLAIDDSGNLYVGGADDTIRKIAVGGAVSTYANVPGYGLAFDSAGYLYAASLSSTTIYKIIPGGGSYTSFGTLIAGNEGLAFDYSGDLYSAQYYADAIARITPDGTTTNFASNMSNPRYLAFRPGTNTAVRAVGFATAIPGGTGNFTELRGPSLSGSLTAFYGAGSGGQQGIYLATRAIPSDPHRIADTATAIPGGTGNFTSFFPTDPHAPAIGSTSVAFFGAGSGGQQGIYGASVTTQDPPIKVADTATAIPGGSGNFTAFPAGPSISGNHAAFAGSGSSGQQGIYFADDVLANGAPITVADTATAIPDGTGNFTSFIPPNPVAPAIAGTSVAFYGEGSGGQQGIYVADSTIPGNPIKVADTNTAIPGGTGNFTTFIPPNPIAPAIDGASVAFFGAGSGGQQGI